MLPVFSSFGFLRGSSSDARTTAPSPVLQVARTISNPQDGKSGLVVDMCNANYNPRPNSRASGAFGIPFMSTGVVDTASFSKVPTVTWIRRLWAL